jgi:hypothetical protein
VERITEHPGGYNAVRSSMDLPIAQEVVNAGRKSDSSAE